MGFFESFIHILHGTEFLSFGIIPLKSPKPSPLKSFWLPKYPALDFIHLLIQHIPEKNFKMTLYYGLYARHRELDNTLNKAVPKSKHHILQSFIKWRNPSLYLLAAPLLTARNAAAKCCSRKFIMTTIEFLYKTSTNRKWRKPNTIPFDFFTCLYHT